MEPAPAPLVRARAEPGADGIRHHVAADGAQLLLGGDRLHGEAVAEQVSPTPVAEVEPLRVARQQVVHPAGEARRLGLDDEMEVIAHQAEGVHVPAVPIDGLGEQVEKGAAIVVVADDRAPLHPAGRDVEEAVARRDEPAREARHRAGG